MIKKLKLPTILGVIVLAFGVVAGIFLINSRQVFKIAANVSAIPKNVRVANITNTSATVSWTTDVKSNGFVKWGGTGVTLNKVATDTEIVERYVHSVDILDIDPNTTIYFKINSNGKDYDNQGVAWQATTLPSGITSTESRIASGTVLNSDAKTPAEAIVYLSINGTVLSSTTSAEGNFVIPISKYLDTVQETTAIEISVQASTFGTALAIVYPKSIKFMPTMILGKSYDFRTTTIEDDNQLPESSLSLPESIEVSSRFEVTRSSEIKETTSTLSVDSIDEGEIITTVDPEFFGSGPKNAEIEIQVESELQTGIVNTNSKGTWKWSPPNNLEAGEHKLTVKWRDTSGILRTVSRTFIVSAAEGPAFESTPSATPVKTSTPVATSTPSSSLIPTSSLPPAVPETGSLTPTLGLFIMGFGVLLSSLFVYRKIDAY